MKCIKTECEFYDEAMSFNCRNIQDCSGHMESLFQEKEKPVELYWLWRINDGGWYTLNYFHSKTGRDTSNGYYSNWNNIKKHKLEIKGVSPIDRNGNYAGNE